MRFEPGFVKDLRQDLSSVQPEIKRRLDRVFALNEAKLVSLVSTPIASSLSDIDQAAPNDVINHDSLTSWKPAYDAIKAGKIALVVIADEVDEATGELKALWRLPKLGITLAGNSLVLSSILPPSKNELIQTPVWYMTSPEFTKQLAQHFCGLTTNTTDLVFEQFETYRLSVDNRLVFREPGIPELHPTGRGDLGPALTESLIWVDFPNVEHVVIVPCTNVLASLDLSILSQHLTSDLDVTCEVIERRDDATDVLAWANDKLQVANVDRLDPGFIERSRYQSTGSMIVSARALRSNFPWRWDRKRVQLGKRLVIQHERSLYQYTELFRTQYVLVNPERRYLPVRSKDDLVIVDKALNRNAR